MTYQEKLVKFMEGKKKALEDMGVEVAREYFTDEDKADILSWSDDVAEKVWRSIKERVGTGYQIEGLSSYTCPFCHKIRLRYNYLTDDACRMCSYAGRHGICEDLDNPDNIFDVIVTDENYIEKVSDFLSLSFYRDLIDEIEQEESKD